MFHGVTTDAIFICVVLGGLEFLIFGISWLLSHRDAKETRELLEEIAVSLTIAENKNDDTQRTGAEIKRDVT